MPTHAYEAGLKQRIVIVEFPSVDAAVACHDGAGYQAALKVFNKAGERDFRIVAGARVAHSITRVIRQAESAPGI